MKLLALGVWGGVLFLICEVEVKEKPWNFNEKILLRPQCFWMQISIHHWNGVKSLCTSRMFKCWTCSCGTQTSRWSWIETVIKVATLISLWLQVPRRSTSSVVLLWLSLRLFRIVGETSFRLCSDTVIQHYFILLWRFTGKMRGYLNQEARLYVRWTQWTRCIL